MNEETLAFRPASRSSRMLATVLGAHMLTQESGSPDPNLLFKIGRANGKSTHPLPLLGGQVRVQELRKLRNRIAKKFRSKAHPRGRVRPQNLAGESVSQGIERRNAAAQQRWWEKHTLPALMRLEALKQIYPCRGRGVSLQEYLASQEPR